MELILSLLIALGISTNEITIPETPSNGATVIRTPDVIIIIKPGNSKGEPIILVDVLAGG